MQTLRQPGKGREGEQPDQNLVRISQRSQMGPRLQTWGGEIAVSRFSFSFPFPRQRTTVGQYFDLLTSSAQQQQRSSCAATAAAAEAEAELELYRYYISSRRV